jgi:hypothetical protein
MPDRLGRELVDLHDEQVEDLFAAGCVIAEMFMERPAFTRQSMHNFIHTGQLPAFLGELPSDVHGTFGVLLGRAVPVP